MQIKKHRRKINHVVIVTSDAVDANVKQFKISPVLLESVIVIACIVLGLMVGYLIYEVKIWDTAIQKSNERVEIMEQLQQENLKLQQAMEAQEEDLTSQIDNLNQKIVVLSNTLEQKVQSETELKEELTKQSIPTELPLNGPAKVEEILEGEPRCVFTTTVEATAVVATASGTVSQILPDNDYGVSVWIDHGNGYVTIYKNKGVLSVKEGDVVVQGATLFPITRRNTKLVYEIKLDDEFISPMDMLSISG